MGDEVISSEDVDKVRGVVAGLGRAWTPMDVAQALTSIGRVASDSTVLTVVEELRRTSSGAGRLEPLLALDGVTDVLVNGPDQVYIDRGRGLELTDTTFTSPDELRSLAVRLAAGVGRRLDDGCPWVDARLADGTRVHAILDVLAKPGTCLSLRVPARHRMSLDDWVMASSMTAETAHLLEQVVVRKLAFLVTGGTGSGKTTLLASLLGCVPAHERIVIVEDSRELSPDHEHVVSLEARAANAEGRGQVSLTDLVRQSLRMRPDRVVLGEVRGAELRDMLMALNTGHEGGCGTVHANGVQEVPARLEALAALSGMNRPAAHAQVAAAFHLVLHLVRGPKGRRLAQIGVFEHVDGCAVVTQALVFDEDLVCTPGPGAERLGDLVGEQTVSRVVQGQGRPRRARRAA
ncbi:TadA family conjugal transfer-associated ATPase [Cutibacterium granulosum]|uniref:Secretory protein n=1 Tax=Cutibacterium granulosum TM11 TaxID=1292373 RepID=A0ACB4UQZ2_9ACTN|nr:TadA family conjugal transfer-associated ATPase [Cutibacterium granulosum]ERS35633.1 helicase/secretion neighborhood ATPase [Propionibacterium sp. KPL1844]MBX7468380.1 TadA family conjugal transfer-associated ATPase [Streptomyces sp. MAG02]MDU3271806.1 TadA family conjugal transfer-associated ATPase [Cutibacterium sp.]ERF67751.1 putative secretory protein [Cutibacterium granulosum TM11]MDU3768058.1 TadA family conjugal transfer-associated ATPase [Cutibacterium granulosum]